MIVMEEKYLFCVPQKALIEKEGKFLIIKRSAADHVFPGHWDLPGGKLEHNEKPQDGLKREVREETNLEINVFDPVFSYLETEFVQAYLTVFECELVSEEIKLSNEHTEYKWATKEEIQTLLIEPYVKELFEKNKLK